MKCFYHNDADGRCAGHVVALATKEIDTDNFIEITYGMEFPFDIIEPDEEVYIVDYSIKPEEMEKLLDITDNVIWIDHHITTISKYNDFPYHINGMRIDGIAGCVLTYMYLNRVTDQEAIPMWVRYIGDRDVWKWEFAETAFFCSGAELYDLHPLSSDWHILESEIEKVIGEGIVVEEYKKQRNEDYMDIFSYDAEFEGYKAKVVNLGRVGSEVFKDLLKEKYDIGIMYVHTGKDFKVSLRSERFDVAELAVKYGGGGHKGASGFECEDIPWRVL